MRRSIDGLATIVKQNFGLDQTAVEENVGFAADRRYNTRRLNGIEGSDKNSKADQALELVERIFAEDKCLECLPENEVKQKRLEIIKPVVEDSPIIANSNFPSVFIGRGRIIMRGFCWMIPLEDTV